MKSQRGVGLLKALCCETLMSALCMVDCEELLQDVRENVVMGDKLSTKA